MNDIQKKLWDAYVLTEKDRIKTVSEKARNEFLRSLEGHDVSEWAEWAYQLCASTIDEGSEFPVRMPIFEKSIYPALRDGIAAKKPGCARWLAGFAQHIYGHKNILAEIGNFNVIEYLRLALVHDPKDHLAMDQLIHVFANVFIFSLHELPAGVLDGMNGASIEACLIYENELQEFEELLRKRNLSEKYDELVQDCKFHYKNYRIYLENKAHYKSYEDYLSKLDPPKK